MKGSTSAIAIITAIASFASAAPAPAPEPAAAATISRSFRLKSQVYNGNEVFNDHYLSFYHTGAGTNAPVMVPASDGGGAVGYLNGSVAVFNYSMYKTILALEQPEDFYADWAGLSLTVVGTSAGPPQDLDGSSFSIGPDGFFTHVKGESENGAEFYAWRICNWVHGGPELFYNCYTPVGDIPASCALVYLVPEYVD